MLVARKERAERERRRQQDQNRQLLRDGAGHFPLDDGGQDARAPAQPQLLRPGGAARGEPRPQRTDARRRLRAVVFALPRLAVRAPSPCKKASL